MRRVAWAVASAIALSGCTMACTEVGCESSLEVAIDHGLDLAEGPYRLEVTTPLHDLRCSFGPAPTGEETCFGHRFSDLSWSADRVTLRLLRPFFDATENPDGAPFEAVEVAVFRGSSELDRATLRVEPGAPRRPNGEGCPPTCWDATASTALP